MLTDVVESYNNWLNSRKGSIIGIFSDIKSLVVALQNKIKKREHKFLIGQAIGIVEWIVILLIKNKQKKFLLGYKVAKTLFEELSMFKNMV